MKVVQINASYKYGSTGRNVYEMHNWLRDRGIDAYAFWATVNSDRQSDPNVYHFGNIVERKIHAVFTRLYGDYGFSSVFSTILLCNKLDTIKPDVVHIHNVHSNNINLKVLFSYLKKKEIPVVITLHDCWFFTGGCMYFGAYNCDSWEDGCVSCVMRENGWRGILSSQTILKRKSELVSEIKKVGIIGVSTWITNEARASALGKVKYFDYVHNWVDLSVFSPEKGKDLRYESQDKTKMVICVSNSWKPLSKGIQDVIYIAKKMPDVKFIVVGRGTESQERLENITYIPFTNDANELAALYAEADVFVNPSRMETFGKVTAEALACGTPAVVYANTGTQELVTNMCGKVCEDGNVEAMFLAVREVLGNGKGYYTKSCREHAVNAFSIDLAGEKHLRMYKMVMEGGNRTR